MTTINQHTSQSSTRCSWRHTYPAITLLLLGGISGCQTMTPPTHTGHQSSLVSPSHFAKSTLANAIGEHLTQERHAVVTYRTKVSPLFSPNDIDAGADNLRSSIIKTYEYTLNQANHEADSAVFRTFDDYMTHPELPYLRYDDEQTGKEPQAIINRHIGMSEEYKEVGRTIEQIDSSLSLCLLTNSNDLDTVVRQNPAITSSDKAVKQIFAQVDTCIQTAHDDLRPVQTQAQSYQLDDIANIKQCAANYHADIKQALAKNRRHAILDGQNYDDYDAVYRNFHVCTDSTKLSLDPYAYIHLEYTKQQLNQRFIRTQCSSLARQRQQALIAEGKNYTQHADDYLQSYYDYLVCLDNHASQILGADKVITQPIQSLTQADEVWDNLTTVWFDDDQTDETDSNKTNWLDQYKKMKQSGQVEVGTAAINDVAKARQGSHVYTGMIGAMLEQAKQTPAQINAQNTYYHDHAIVTTLSHHQPALAKWDYLIDMDYQSATANYSVQLPISFNLGQNKLTADVSAGLPILAMMMPQYAPLPSEVPKGLVDFGMPKQLQGVLPLAVVYQAINEANIKLFESLDDELFTAVDIRQDDFAKQLGATSAIKLHIDAHVIGKNIGIIGKYIAQNLKQHIDTHPDSYSDSQLTQAKIHALIDDWLLINQGHHINDVGDVFMLINSILPINLYGSSYYYLNAQGKLIGVQTVQTLEEPMQQQKRQTIVQTRYGKAYFDKMPLAGQFRQTFANNTAVNGNAWLTKLKQETMLAHKAAQYRENQAPLIELNQDDHQPSDSTP